jgi:hypothetical protein
MIMMKKEEVNIYIFHLKCKRARPFLARDPMALTSVAYAKKPSFAKKKGKFNVLE